MKICFWVIGKTDKSYLREGCTLYQKKLKHYLTFEYDEFPNVKVPKKALPAQVKVLESSLVLDKLKSDDYLILLDEKGKNYTSRQFAAQLDKWQQQSAKRLVFLVGGAFGFDKTVYARANAQLSLSSMTFSHQMIRLFFLEQLYRGMSILRNEPYHND